MQLMVSRQDLLHPKISGNKWYKLKHNIAQAKASGAHRLVSFGGAYSNHLHALAYAGQLYDLDTIGLVRGEIINPLNPTLQDAVDWGMQLIAVSRSEYRRRNEADFLEQLIRPFEPCYVIPEGGANLLAVKGCAEIAQGIERQVDCLDYLCVPCGTGATLAGLVSGLTSSQTKVLGFCALKGLQDLEEKVAQLLSLNEYDSGVPWQVIHAYPCGGFARLSSELIQFMDRWQEFSDIPLEPLYTGKMRFGLFQLIEQNYFLPGSCIVAIHTGGLQGLRGMRDKLERYRRQIEVPR